MPPAGLNGYVGRFAPSPTGPLHFGSLVAALGSFLDARRHQGRWLVRIEDIDRPRNQPGAAQSILTDLERLGLHWDGPVHYQSNQTARHLDAIRHLLARGLAFPCACSRKEVGTGLYPGTCREGLPAGRDRRSVRLRVSESLIALDDAVQGRFEQCLGTDVGDFVIYRADAIVAYHLAVTVDDADAGVTTIVRGSDLLDSTPRQIALFHAFDRPVPSYAHLPVAANPHGQKLSKQTHAPPIQTRPAEALLGSALRFLGQDPPPLLEHEPVQTIVEWGIKHWSIAKVPSRMSVQLAQRTDAN